MQWNAAHEVEHCHELDERIFDDLGFSLELIAVCNSRDHEVSAQGLLLKSSIVVVLSR